MDFSSPEGSWEDDYLQPSEDFNYEDQQTALDECKNVFSSKDCIMEPFLHDYVKRFLDAAGPPEEFVELLAENYTGTAQVANLMADWLIVAGCDVSEVQDMVENHLKDMILKYFDPKKADSIFTAAGQTPDWIEGMIAHPPWRKLFYELAEKNPDCLLLNFSIKLISDAGYQGEIGSMSSACNQIDVFVRVLKSSIINYITGKGNNDEIVTEIAKTACRGKHTYLFTQCLLHYLSQTTENGACPKRLSQELQRAAASKGHDVWNITLSLCGGSAHPNVSASLSSMLSRKQLNPGDITTLYKAYTSADPPPVELLRIPLFLELLVDCLFKPESNINPDHKSKYTYLLGYSASAYETWKDGERISLSKDELKGTVQAVDRVHSVCSREIGGTLQLSSEVGMLYHCIRYPVVAMGILKWVEQCLSETNYLKVMTDATPLHVVLLDEVSTCHPIQHPPVLKLLIKLFSASYPGLETLVELEFKKTILDRMVHMLSRGYVIPVVQFIRKCMDSQLTDISLIRHFVTEVLEMIAPPYSREFTDIFLPIVKNDSITEILRTSDKKDDVSRFLSMYPNFDHIFPDVTHLSGSEDNLSMVSQESALITELLTSYNKIIRPTTDHVSPLQLTMGLIVKQLVKFDEKKQVITWNVWIKQDEKKQVITWNVWIKQVWKDFRLEWNTTKYNIKRVVVSPKLLWVPDLYLYNNACEGYTGVDYGNEDSAFIDYNGTITWISKVILRSSCKFDVRFFPFDKQSCILEFGSWAFSGNKINLTMEKDSGVVSLNAPNGEWSILGLPAIRKVAYYACCPEPYPSIIYTLNVQRRSLFYLHSFLGPSVWIALLSMLAFCLPFKSDERVTLLITSLLSVTLFFTLIADLTPPDPEGTPLVARFMVAVLIEMGIAIMIICFIINIEPNVTHTPWVISKVVNTLLRKALFFSEHRLQTGSNQDVGRCTETSTMSFIRSNESNLKRPKRTIAASSNVQDICIEDITDEETNDNIKEIQDNDVIADFDYSLEFKKTVLPLINSVTADSIAETNRINVKLERRAISKKMDRLLHLLFLFIILVTFTVFLMIPPELHL